MRSIVSFSAIAGTLIAGRLITSPAMQKRTRIRDLPGRGDYRRTARRQEMPEVPECDPLGGFAVPEEMPPCLVRQLQARRTDRLAARIDAPRRRPRLDRVVPAPHVRKWIEALVGCMRDDPWIRRHVRDSV